MLLPFTVPPAMVVLSSVACFCLVVAQAVAISAPGVVLNVPSLPVRDIAIEDRRTRAVCSDQELNTRLLGTLCEYGQPVVDAISECGGETWSTVARTFVLLCRTSPEGTPCGNLFTAGLSVNPIPPLPFGPGYQFIETVISNCFPPVGTCQPACRDAITALRNNLGCCVDFYTALFGGFSGISSAINYTFWRSCGVESPSNCESSLSFTQRAAERQPPCSGPEISEIIAERFSCARGGQEFLESIGNCDLADANFGFRIQDICAVNERGISCYDRDILSLLDTIFNPATRSVCNVAGNNTSQCLPECRRILQRFANSSVGCCVNNLFNHTDNPTVPGFQLQYITNYELWSACGFDTPGFCPSYQFNSGQMLKATTVVVFLLVLLLHGTLSV